MQGDGLLDRAGAAIVEVGRRVAQSPQWGVSILTARECPPFNPEMFAEMKKERSAWTTIDAGPQVKVLCAAGDAPRVVAGLEMLPGVERVLVCGPGRGAEVIG